MRKLLYGLWLLASLAMMCLVLGFIAWKLGVRSVAGWFYAGAEYGLLLVFWGVGVWVVVSVWLVFWRDISAYCSGESRSLRRLLFQQYRCRNQQLRQQQSWRHIQWRFQQQRLRLVVINARQQRKRLLKALHQELDAAKNQLGQDEYRRLRRALRLAYRRADDSALLALRARFACL